MRRAARFVACLWLLAVIVWSLALMLRLYSDLTTPEACERDPGSYECEGAR